MKRRAHTAPATAPPPIIRIVCNISYTFSWERVQKAIMELRESNLTEKGYLEWVLLSSLGSYGNQTAGQTLASAFERWKVMQAQLRTAPGLTLGVGEGADD